MNSLIKIDNLKKSYGDITAVNKISFDVGEGEMFGLVGPDGAGKTTTIRICCGLINADEGEVKIFDKNILEYRKEIQNEIGYLSQKFSLYGDLSVDENIEFFADIHRVKNFHSRRDELLQFTRLTPFRNRLADQLSGGMKQKLALACSLIHKPKILFLDEPTTGVDPVSRRDFWKILSSLMKEGITIFMTTPYLDEAERCNRVALMHRGEIISLDTPEKIKNSVGKKSIEIITSDIKSAYKILKSIKEYEIQIFGDRLNIIADSPAEVIARVSEILHTHKIQLLNYRLINLSLENVFIHLINK
ncbi:MAG: ABC transporter ATP-binding protein [Ignavibacterium album]|jgi:ABC-2 type transport system ATP-binding protein|uniref:ABC transporter ATP-binding protein n=1 Tax=Ignavibacterium album TaxID=591197 RepID=UPI0026E9710B|nr:ABC transporter ATP-binding protein [Ignavibacterium album]MCX8105736.1 ABC transporter ATP-binding protein [Ignavibacterium album]